MTEAETFARNQRFSGHRSCILTQCPDGVLALFEWGGCGNLLYLGTDGAELLRVFAARPEWKYAPQPRKPLVVSGINLDELEIDL